MVSGISAIGSYMGLTGGMFRRLDMNGNGRLERSEVGNRFDFSAADINGDNRISHAEYLTKPSSRSMLGRKIDIKV
jgi:hypothetical protein